METSLEHFGPELHGSKNDNVEQVVAQQHALRMLTLKSTPERLKDVCSFLCCFFC